MITEDTGVGSVQNLQRKVVGCAGGVVHSTWSYIDGIY